MSTRKGLRFCYTLPIILILLFISTSCTSLKQWAYEGNERDEWQHPEQVIKALKIQPGDHIADLGSGSGYFTFRLADAAGPTGKVYAVDVDENMNQLIAEKAKETDGLLCQRTKRPEAKRLHHHHRL